MTAGSLTVLLWDLGVFTQMTLRRICKCSAFFSPHDHYNDCVFSHGSLVGFGCLHPNDTASNLQMLRILLKCKNVRSRMNSWRTFLHLRALRACKFFLVVGVARFELAALRSRTVRATKLRYTPIVVFNYVVSSQNRNVLLCLVARLALTEGFARAHFVRRMLNYISNIPERCQGIAPNSAARNIKRR